MANNVVIPGSDLDRASANLSQVLQHIDVARGPGDLGSAVGAPLRDAAEHFESRWSDGRAQLHREIEKILEAMDKIKQAFEDTDEQTASNLGGQK